MNETVKLEIVRGVGGNCLYIDEENRIGPKPAGGGNTLATIVVPREDLLDALGMAEDVELPVVTGEEPALAEQNLIMGRIVRYVDGDGSISPAIVTFVHDEERVELYVFPQMRDSFYVNEVVYNDNQLYRSWHWPSDR